MPLRKRKEPRDSRSLARGSTKKRAKLRETVRPWQVVTLILCGLTGIILALVLGNYLQSRSDAYREEQAGNQWLSGGEVSPSRPATVPEFSAVAIKPEGNVGDILIAGKHGGVILPLCGDDGIPLYTSRVADAAGMAVNTEAPSLTEDIIRVSKRGLNVTVIYTVTCFSTPNSAVAAYRRGLDLALLRECAEARPNDILLLGLPSGNDTADRRAAEFLSELKALLADLPAAPAIGVALPPSAFAGDSLTGSDGFAHGSEAESDSSEGNTANRALYAGNLSPARLLSFCDYIAMDLRAMSAVGVSTLLPDIAYAYGRYSLRLLVNIHDREAVDAAYKQGYTRVFETEPPPVPSGSDETESE